jgi:hypothetical protein
VQFVYTEPKFCNLLFFLEREFVHLYQILYRKRGNGGYGSSPSALICISSSSSLGAEIFFIICLLISWLQCSYYCAASP